MDLPAGKKLAEGLRAAETDWAKKLGELMEQDFTGYSIETLEGSTGIEEAILLVRKGLIVGAYYEFSALQKEEFGQKALPLVFNAFKAPFGILDLNGLTNQQLDLIIAFQEKVIIEKEIPARDFSRYLPRSYSPRSPEELVAGEQKEVSKMDVFKRLGLVGVGEK